MFNNLSNRLTNIARNLIGIGRLTEENIKNSIQEVKIALLEADVALEVVKQFIDDVQAKAIGQEVLQSIQPGEAFIKIVSDELTKTLGATSAELNFHAQPPAIILVAGLQGSGKTTSIAKLAKWLTTTQKKSVMLTSVDVYRPAALEQLQILAQQIDVAHFPATAQDQPLAIAKAAIEHAKTQFKDVLIIDTAGRLHLDQEMMDEIKKLHQATNPVETLLVVDCMTGQDAANIGKAFAQALPLTGIILTKTDGDARGGAALSMRILTQKPIKFIGTGEKLDAFEVFHPDRITSRILGMGDIVSLVEEAQQKIDQQKAAKLAKKFQKGKAFDFEDFKEQLQQMKKMGGIAGLISKLPSMGVNLPQTPKNIDEKMFTKMEAIINSMTPRERHFPALIKGSHKKRIAGGSGTEVQDVNRLLRQFEQMQKMMKRLKGSRMFKMI